MCTEQRYDGVYQKVPISAVFKQMWALHIAVAILIPLSAIVSSSSSSSPMEGFAGPIVIAVGWAVSMALVVMRHRRIYVLTEKGQIQKAEAEAQLLFQQAKRDRGSAELLDKWLIRYPLGLSLYGLALWILSLKGDWTVSILAAAIALWAASLTREVALLVLAIAGVYWMGNAMQSVSTPAAIIIGAIIIALAIKK